MTNLASLWRSTNFLSQSIGTIFFSINHSGCRTVKFHSSVRIKQNSAKKEKKNSSVARKACRNNRRQRESGEGVGEMSGRSSGGPRGSLTNSSTRAEGTSEASQGQMQLRERANQKVNKVAGPHGSDGLPGNHYCLDGEDRCGQEERVSFSFPGKDREMPRMAEKTQPLWGGKERNCKSELRLLEEARKRLELPDGGDVSGDEREQRAKSRVHHTHPCTRRAEPAGGKPSLPQPSVGPVLCLVIQLCLTLATPWTAAHQAPLSMGLSRQEYWRELPCPPPGDLPNPGIELRSATLQADSLPSEPPGKPILAPLHPPLHAYCCLARLAPGPVNLLQALTEGIAAWNIPQPWGPAIF